MNNEELISAVIRKYELLEPVSADVRRHMEQSRKYNLVKILKKDAGRGLFITAAVSFFLWIKKFGISLSIVKSSAAVAAAVIIGAGAITAAGVYGTIKITGYLSKGSLKSENSIPETTAPVESIEKKETPALRIITYALAVTRVEMDDTPQNVLKEYTDTVISELRRSRGANAAIDFDMLDAWHRSDRILSISIIKLDEKSESIYRVSAKIIGSSNSRVLKHVSETVANENDITSALRKLTTRVSSGL